ncbi:hypothetical protein AURDEDRAFT_115920 [Auricularia subglabra TFB-10046 SS5]|nr:hypothetical protein AURDEDRAFT_115920 [Auricularia subglabra TFB-10046 SS5]
MEWATNLFKRVDREFIGWHGTNSDTAEFWRKKGYLAKPAGGRSGGAQQLGEGVYVSDTRKTAEMYANGNASNNKGTTAVVCAIYAKSSTHWRSSVYKVWVPADKIGDSKEAARREWISTIFPHADAGSVARFSPLEELGRPPNQVVIPSALAKYFTAVCISANASAIPHGAVEDYSYNLVRDRWDVRDTPCGN